MNLFSATHKNTSLITIIILSVFILFCALAFAQEAHAASTGVVNVAGGVNVRTGPGTNYDRIGGFDYGQTVTVTGSSGGWYIVDFNGRTGYVSAEYITLRSDGDFSQTTATVKSAIGLNVRSGPGTGYGVVFTLENNTVVTVTDKEGDWYKISYNGRTGYVSGDYLELKENPEYVHDEDFEASLAAQGFPESYKFYLRQLHAAHPEWVFKAQNTGLDWTTVINKETERVSTNLVHKSQPDSWKSYESGALYPDGSHIEFDSGGYVAASRSIVEYFMDPRNFLSEGGVFQFMSHSYDAQTQTEEGLQQLVSGTFLANKFPEKGYDTYSDVLIYAAQQSDANPYVLASMILVEQGRDGGGNSISGKVSGYEGYYNFFNVGAYASGSLDAVQNGLEYAKGSGSYNRPWNTRLKSIVGGAVHYAESYIKNNQNTLYLKKFNVMNGLNSVATHQYMTNVSGASQEAANLSKGYVDSGAVTFYIPVYKNMPETACLAPGSGNNDYFLKSLSVSGFDLMPAFSTYGLDYELVVPSDTSYITVSAVAHDSGASVSGTGKVQLTGNVTEVKVTVTATSGVRQTYTITVAREQAGGEDISSSEYNIGSNITGVDLKTSVEVFKQNVSVPAGYTMKVLDASGSEVTAGNVGTGMRVVLYSGDAAVKSHVVVVKGDTSGDGNCNSLDLLQIQKHIVNMSVLTNCYFTGADINSDGKVNSLDLLYVQKYIVGSYIIKN